MSGRVVFYGSRSHAAAAGPARRESAGVASAFRGILASAPAAVIVDEHAPRARDVARAAQVQGARLLVLRRDGRCATWGLAAHATIDAAAKSREAVRAATFHWLRSIGIAPPPPPLDLGERVRSYIRNQRN